MPLIRAQDITISFGSTAILDKASLTIDDGARIALVGRNGEGKSTLLKIIAGLIQPDAGDIVRSSGLKTAYLPQAVPVEFSGTAYQVVADGLGEAGRLIGRYFHDSKQLASGETRSEDGTSLTDRLASIQYRLDAIDGWEMIQKVDQVLSKMCIEPSADFVRLSGGMKRRVVLARALASEPDILLLDEPTNHLDIGAVDWLEKYLQSLRCALVFVTHDRHFLEAVATHICEIDRGQLTHWSSGFARYRVDKQKMLETEAQQNALFDKKLAQEETWIRQGIKARRTRNEGRVRALKKLREEYAARRKSTEKARMIVNQAERSGKIIVECDAMSFSYGLDPIVADMSTTIMRDDRIGIIGPNGCGKSTLVRLFVGELQPISGTIKQGTQLEVAYYDQLRSTLDTDLSAADNVSGGRDSVFVNGSQRHIMSYMQDFLFEPIRARAPITALSGGELGRLMLAKLFLKPSNLIVLDEPSNDLDIETLELLESLLSDYRGTVILISHDRQLIENVVTRSFVYQGNGRFLDVVGGYENFELERARSTTLKPVFADTASPETQTQAKIQPNNSSESQPASQSTKGKHSLTSRKSKLTYAQSIELAKLPEKIGNLETQLASIHQQMNEPEFFADREQSDKTLRRSQLLQADLDEALERWETLEQLASS